jgi:hypothetical protein
VERIQRVNHNHVADRVPSPRPRPGSPNCSSPRHSRPSSRGSSVSGVSASLQLCKSIDTLSTGDNTSLHPSQFAVNRIYPVTCRIL